MTKNNITSNSGDPDCTNTNTMSVFVERLSYFGFLKYIAPSVISMVAVSFYTAVDGFFVSRFVNSDGLAAINIIIPFSCLIYAVSLMLATGSGAYVAMKMGEDSTDDARKLFSFVTYILVAIGLLITIVSYIYLEPGLRLLGATDVLMPYAVDYGQMTVLMVVPMMLKLYFEQYARVEGCPSEAFWMSTVGLVANIILVALFTAVIPWRVKGAGLGTFLSILISALMGVKHFTGKKTRLKLGRPKAEWLFLLRSAVNGMSQFLAEISTGVVTLLLNLTMLSFNGEDGVAAIGVVMFLYYFFMAIYMGISSGAAPIVSYSRGAETPWKEKEILHHGRVTIFWVAAAIVGTSLMAGNVLIRIFTDEPNVVAIAAAGNRPFSLCYLFAGLSIFVAAYFTAVGKGRTAALVSSLRCLVFSSIGIIVLPRFFGETGLWLAIPVAEFLTAIVAAILIYTYTKGIGKTEKRER